MSKADAVLSYSVLDLNINLSHHRPICIVYSVTFDRIASCNDADDDVQHSSSVDCVPQLRGIRQISSCISILLGIIYSLFIVNF